MPEQGFERPAAPLLSLAAYLSYVRPFASDTLLFASRSLAGAASWRAVTIQTNIGLLLLQAIIHTFQQH